MGHFSICGNYFKNLHPSIQNQIYNEVIKDIESYNKIETWEHSVM